MLKDRAETALKLAAKLKKFQHDNALVLAISNGGVLMGRIIAEELVLPLEIIVSDQIGHPDNHDFAIGTVCLQSRIIKRRVYVSREYIEKETLKIRNLLKPIYKSLMGKDSPISFQDREILLVADTIENYALLLNNISLIKQCKPKRIVMVSPGGCVEMTKYLSRDVDEIICLEEANAPQANQVYIEKPEDLGDMQLIKVP